jgi:AraC-like DNA-binding protein
MTLLSEGRDHLQQIWFPHAAVASDATYRSRFDVAPTFKADRIGLAYAARDLKLPISEQNRQLHDLATTYLGRQLPRGRTRCTVQVRQAIEALLGTGTCGYRQIANALYMHPRTLQRRLKEEDTTFEGLKDKTRRDLARRYLSQPDVPLAQVAALLDYGEQSALGRSCRRWFNATPQQLRGRLLTAEPVPSMA